ncbi:MAG: hypothetical protein IKO81_02835 [Bacteroidales bacterium]|nr:hypothetical protein [Bacteroidales bacterium]MBR6904902.1 hypothetical protein [Bacteroidales bacterium]
MCRRSRSVNTLHYTSVIGGDSAIVTALTGGARHSALLRSVERNLPAPAPLSVLSVLSV